MQKLTIIKIQIRIHDQIQLRTKIGSIYLNFTMKRGQMLTKVLTEFKNNSNLYS